jgi:hypothetical protein
MIQNNTTIPLILKNETENYTIAPGGQLDGILEFTPEGFTINSTKNDKNFVFTNLDNGYDKKFYFIHTMFLKNSDNEFYRRIDIIEQNENGKLLTEYMEQKDTTEE